MQNVWRLAKCYAEDTFKTTRSRRLYIFSVKTSYYILVTTRKIYSGFKYIDVVVSNIIPVLVLIWNNEIKLFSIFWIIWSQYFGSDSISCSWTFTLNCLVLRGLVVTNCNSQNHASYKKLLTSKMVSNIFKAIVMFFHQKNWWKEVFIFKKKLILWLQFIRHETLH